MTGCPRVERDAERARAVFWLTVRKIGGDVYAAFVNFVFLPCCFAVACVWVWELLSCGS